MVKRLLDTIVEWMLYSNLFIAFCAICMVWLTRGAFGSEINTLHPYEWALFLATVSLYAFHRYIGIVKIADVLRSGRFIVLSEYRSHLLIYGLVSGAISGSILVYFYPLPFLLMMMPAVVIGFLYILPVFPSSRRLRDYAFIKIVLIGLAWAWLTVVMPLHEYGSDLNWEVLLFSLDRFLFIIAITLPFDIRDLEVDKIEGVKTFPMIFGEEWSKTSAIMCLLMGLVCLGTLFVTNAIDLKYFLSAGMTYTIAGFLIMRSRIDRHDYYYSGLMDGIMILYFLLWFLLDQL